MRAEGTHVVRTRGRAGTRGLLSPPLLSLLLLEAVGGAPNPRVHAYYYLWYGNPETDGRFMHWDHEVLPHWTPAIRDKYPHGPGTRHDAARGIIHAPYYPALGPYSSSDPGTVDAHMRGSRSRAWGLWC